MRERAAAYREEERREERGGEGEEVLKSNLRFERRRHSRLSSPLFQNERGRRPEVRVPGDRSARGRPGWVPPVGAGQPAGADGGQGERIEGERCEQGERARDTQDAPEKGHAPRPA